MPEFTAIDLTAAQPSWLNSDGRRGAIWPSFCLPWFRGEPPLVGELARMHRRASSLESLEPEAKLDLSQRGRWHWAEGWLATTRVPDSAQPSNTSIEWVPPGERRTMRLEFASVVDQIAMEVSGAGSELCLVVPGALGPGPREELLTRLGKSFARVHLLPRTIALALEWCRSDEGRDLLDGCTEEVGTRLGSLLVTVAGADLWEAAVVPLRLQEHQGEHYLCPVHDRTQVQAEIGILGLPWSACQSVSLEVGPEELWHRWLQSADTGATDPLDRESYSKAQHAFFQSCLPAQIEEGWKPGNQREAILSRLERIAQPGLLSWAHAGFANKRDVPSPLADFGRVAHAPARVFDDNSLLAGGLLALQRLASGAAPYFEALAPLQLHVLGRNKFMDPVSQWQELVGATEVPTGQEYSSPEPISGLSLPSGQVPSIDLHLRARRLGNWEYRHVVASQKEPQQHPESVSIVARMKPGQGLARVEVNSVTPGLFRISVNESHLALTDGPPPLKYAWPPGSAYVVSHSAIAQDAFPTIRAASKHSLNGIVNYDELKRILDAIDVWPRPQDRFVDVRALTIPPEIHPEFVYLGAFPSHSASRGSLSDSEAEQLCSLLLSTYDGTESSKVRSRVMFVASWLYDRCPDRLMGEVRREFEHGRMTKPWALACAGNCFSEERDFRLFFCRLARLIQMDQVGAPGNWLRAYRNLARFRVDALGVDSLTSAQQDLLSAWYLRVFESACEDARSRDYMWCVYLAPHFLKRRRFDSQFFSTEDANFYRLAECLHKAEKAARNRNHGVNASCALEFLHERASQSTLERLQQSGGA